MNENEGHREMNELEALQGTLDLARLSRRYFEALVEEGWPEQEAFVLTLAWQAAVCTP